MIELLQFAPAPGLMNPSPFCMKVEVFLRLAGLPYRTVTTLPPGTPRGKLPVLRDEGVVVADSEAIIAYLQQREAPRLPPALAAPETPLHLLVRRTLEEHTYFVAMHWRWIDPAGWGRTREALFGSLPAPARALVAGLVRRKIRRDLKGQGLGRHDPDSLARRGLADLDALARLLGAGPFFGGAEPAAVDACVHAFIANLAWDAVESPLRDHLRSSPVWTAYGQAMRERVGA